MPCTDLKRRTALLNSILSNTFNQPISLKSGKDGESGGASYIIRAAYFCNLWILSRLFLEVFPHIVKQ